MSIDIDVRVYFQIYHLFPPIDVHRFIIDNISHVFSNYGVRILFILSRTIDYRFIVLLPFHHTQATNIEIKHMLIICLNKINILEILSICQ